MSRFDEFWEAWPKNGQKPFQEYTRKVNRKKANEKWDAYDLDKQADVILADVRKRAKFDKAWLKDRGKYLCAPLVYLNNERWLDDSGIADIRDQGKEESQQSGNGMAFEDVRRGVYSAISLGYPDESILKTFDIKFTIVNKSGCHARSV